MGKEFNTKTLIFLFSMFVGIALTLTAMRPTGTGDVIGSLTTSSAGWFGIFFFIFGIAGFFFSNRK